MTENKPIIINGVDVSGCINYTDELKGCSCRLNYAPFHYRFCEQNPNCYYKQLKHKEQKLDKIKTICEKETTKSTFCNGIENKDTQKLAIRILKIIIGGKNNG